MISKLNDVLTQSAKSQKKVEELGDKVKATVKKQGLEFGRNQKVTVKYGDGTTKKDVKYKRVEADIKNGKCTVIA